MNAILRSGFLALVIMLALAVPADAGPFEDGEAAYERGDFATALKFWRPLAKRGNAGAQKALGVMYDNGYGVPQDSAEAAKWYRLANAQVPNESKNVDWFSKDSITTVENFPSLLNSRQEPKRGLVFYDAFSGGDAFERVYASLGCEGPGNFSLNVTAFENEEIARWITADKAEADLSTINRQFSLAGFTIQFSELSGLWNIGFISWLHTDEIWYALLEASAIEITVGNQIIHIALNAADKTNLATVAEACLGGLPP